MVIVYFLLVPVYVFFFFYLKWGAECMAPVPLRSASFAVLFVFVVSFFFTACLLHVWLYNFVPPNIFREWR